MWTAVRLLSTLAIIQGLASRHIDFILAYPQAEVDGELFIKVSKGI